MDNTDIICYPFVNIELLIRPIKHRLIGFTDINLLFDGSSDRSLMAAPVSYFSFQPVLHDWCNKGHGMCYPVYGMVNIKDP